MWLIGFRIKGYHSWGSDHCCGTGSVPSLGTFTCWKLGITCNNPWAQNPAGGQVPPPSREREEGEKEEKKKKKKKKKKNPLPWCYLNSNFQNPIRNTRKKQTKIKVNKQVLGNIYYFFKSTQKVKLNRSIDLYNFGWSEIYWKVL